MKEENKNKMYAQPKYKCAICDTVHDDVQSRMNCEMKCLKKQQEEEKAAAEAKKKAEKDARQQEVTAALDNAFALMNQFIEDYGTYQYDGKLNALEARNLSFFPSKLWHHFFF